MEKKEKKYDEFDAKLYIESIKRELTNKYADFSFVERVVRIRENIATFSLEQLQELLNFLNSADVYNKCNIGGPTSDDSQGWWTLTNMVQAVVTYAQAQHSKE